MNVYLDELFLINAVSDFLLLMCAGKISGTKASCRRNIIASVLGGLYSIAMVFPQISFAQSLFFRTVFSAFMVFTAVGATPGFFKTLAGFYIAMFIYGGIIIFLMNTGADAVIYGGHLYFNFPIIKFLLTLTILTLTLNKISNFFKNSLIKNGIFCDVKIRYGNNEIHSEGILDTGNFLKSPLNGRFVAAVGIDAVRGLFCEDFSNAVAENDILLAMSLEKATLIPYRTVDEKSCLMVSVIPDLFEINGKSADVVLGIVPVGKNIVINPMALN